MATLQNGSPIDVVKEKIEIFLSKYPQVDDVLKQVSSKIGVEKPYVTIGIALLPVLLLLFAIGSGDFIV